MEGGNLIMSLKRNVKNLLKSRDQNQNDLANLLGISYQSVSLKLNRKSSFTYDELFVIVTAYNLTPEELYNTFFDAKTVIPGTK